MNKIPYYYLIANLWVIFLGISLILYAYFIDGTYVNRPIQYLSNPMNIQLEHSTYNAGDTVRGYISFCKAEKTWATTSWEIVDGQLIALTPMSGAAPAGCYTNVLFTIGKLPTYIHNDTAHLDGEVDFQINPLHTVKILLKTEAFTIN